MKKIFLFSVLVLLFSVFHDAGAQKAAKSMYFEIGGPGISSFNYDTRFSPREDGIGGRIGVGGFSLGSVSLLAIPVGLNYLFGNDDRHYFELGGGVSYLSFNDDDDFDNDNNGILETTIGYLTFGYRLQPKNGGFLFKASIVPVFNKNGFLPYYGGIAFGYKFGSKKQ